MLSYIIRRLLWMVLLLVVISFLTFMIFYLLPSADPAVLRAGKQPTPELVHTIREQLGLDKPWYVQYWKYLDRLAFHFDFGTSYQNQVSVKSQIFDRVPATIGLALGGAVVWLLIGIPIGIISAIKRGKLADRLAMGGALVLISAPVYWLGLVALYLFSKGIGVVGIFDGAGTYPTTARTSSPTRSPSRRRCSCPGSCSPRRSPRSTRGSCAATCSRRWPRTTSAPPAPRACPSAA